jgi:hypothetical protein
MNKKIFVLLPDGVGLRNFAFTEFHDIGVIEGFDIVYWNNTTCDLTKLGFKECKIRNPRLHPFTDILKNAKIQIELNQFINKTNDKVYDTYRFPSNNVCLKSKLKRFLTNCVITLFNSVKGLKLIRGQISRRERETNYYRESLETLKKEQPNFVFCTNQRAVISIAPLLAAQDLGIPTATFIFSWDNLPKATMIVETDYYFVWSDFMKKEILFYYPYIKETQIFVTGTPQFEPHFDESLLIDKNEFFCQYSLEENKKYICFSGDDITTSPDDEQYLEDLAKAIESLNSKGYNLGIIFRRCPVDFSNRYDTIIKKFHNIIHSINPIWNQNGDSWNTVIPSVGDLKLQVNIIANSELVVNIASSMVFDFAVFNKPCLYINYNAKNKKLSYWNSQTIYEFVHFRSMPNSKAVIWLNSSEEIASKIEKTLADSKKNVSYAKSWFEIINQHPPQYASQRIWESIKIITQ